MRKAVWFVLLFALALTSCKAEAAVRGQSEDWADAFAGAALERDNLWSLELMDIDGDGIPEAMERLSSADSTPAISRIFGYEQGTRAVWYDRAETGETFGQVFFVRAGETAKCIAIENSASVGGVFRMGVFELVKGTRQNGGAIVPLVVSETTCFGDPARYADVLGDDVEAAVAAQRELFEAAVAAMGEEIPARTLLVPFDGSAYTAETLARELREW
jgi:hypothetical protein